MRRPRLGLVLLALLALGADEPPSGNTGAYAAILVFVAVAAVVVIAWMFANRRRKS